MVAMWAADIWQDSYEHDNVHVTLLCTECVLWCNCLLFLGVMREYINNGYTAQSLLEVLKYFSLR